MVSMMNKELSVYLLKYLVDAGMGKVFVKSLIQGVIFLEVNHPTGTCTWYNNNHTKGCLTRMASSARGRGMV